VTNSPARFTRMVAASPPETRKATYRETRLRPMRRTNCRANKDGQVEPGPPGFPSALLALKRETQPEMALLRTPMAPPKAKAATRIPVLSKVLLPALVFAARVLAARVVSVLRFRSGRRSQDVPEQNPEAGHNA